MIYDLIPKLIRASFEQDRKTIEAISLAMIKKLKKQYPEVASDIAKTLSYSNAGAPIIRSIDLNPLPVDRETRYSLVKLEEPTEFLPPILNEYIETQLNDFLKERAMIETFITEGVVPPNSILLDGQPGVGKTYIAKWLAYKLNLPLITLDLASSISSYLGRTGQNIKSIFDYAKSENAVLFLDELDAIAKRRDDSSDLGELKRLVNVLLKELELCPSTCVIIGATNHPELLDKAIWRRFDRTLTIPMPAELERKNLLVRYLDKYATLLSGTTMSVLVKYTQSVNAADISKLCEHIKRHFLMEGSSLDLIALTEMFKIATYSDRTDKMGICKMLKNNFPHLKYREIAQITNIPLTSVDRYLKENK